VARGYDLPATAVPIGVQAAHPLPDVSQDAQMREKSCRVTREMSMKPGFYCKGTLGKRTVWLSRQPHMPTLDYSAKEDAALRFPTRAAAEKALSAKWWGIDWEITEVTEPDVQT
jgi:hypothetical protein